MRVLVTGATGFVGRHVVKRLASQHHQVVAVHREHSNLADIDCESIECIKCDLGDAEQVQRLIESLGKIDAVVHLAWQGLPNYRDLIHIEANLPQSYHFLKKVIEAGVQRILVTGTCLEYGMIDGALSEDQVVQPTCSYAIAKDSLRRFLELLQATYKFNLTWARLFYVYGPGQNSRSLLSQLQTAVARGDAEFPMSGGEQLRDFLPIEQAAEYLTSLVELYGNHGIVNICQGKPTSVRRLVEQWLVTENKRIQLKLGVYPYPDYEPLAFWGDNRKLNHITHQS
jgi:dTDP-6-deoxy-L-talose 4-dehydrogenase (NAD+)